MYFLSANYCLTLPCLLLRSFNFCICLPSGQVHSLVYEFNKLNGNNTYIFFTKIYNYTLLFYAMFFHCLMLVWTHLWSVSDLSRTSVLYCSAMLVRLLLFTYELLYNSYKALTFLIKSIPLLHSEICMWIFISKLYVKMESTIERSQLYMFTLFNSLEVVNIFGNSNDIVVLVLSLVCCGI